MSVLPNSDGQRALLAARSRADDSRSRHCLNASVEILGPVDPARLRARLARIAGRRPALRSRFVSADGHLLVDGDPPEVLVRRLDAPTAAARWRQAHELARTQAHRPFPAGATPLVRAALLTAEDERHLLTLDVDPLVCDAWSANLLLDDLLDETPADPPGEDDYVAVWCERQAWLESPAGSAATARRRAEVDGAWRRWPVPAAGPDRADLCAPDETVEVAVDLDDEVGAALRERVRKARGSLLAAGAAALAASAAPTASAPLAITTTLAARETTAEERVVGWLANDGVLAIPPVAGTVLEHLTAIRGQIYGALRHQRVPYERLRPCLGDPPGGAGLSFSLLFLPEQLSGGDQDRPAYAATRAIRTAVTICPTGADVDLYLVERPPPQADGRRPLIRLGAASRRGAAGTAGTTRILADWTRALTRLARSSWSHTPARDIAADPAPAGGARPWT